MEIYPEKNGRYTSYHATRMMRRTVHFFGVYLHPPRNYYSHSLKNFFRWLWHYEEIIVGADALFRHMCVLLISVWFSKWKYQRMFETQKVLRHDKFRNEWSQHENKCKSHVRQDQVYIVFFWHFGFGTSLDTSILLIQPYNTFSPI